MSRVFYVTTPIYYANGDPHIGHTYTTVVADTVARYHRMAGHETFFLTGTDEHGEKVAEAAAAEGISPQELADRNSARFREAWDTLGISYDRFIRTTDPDHVRAVQVVLQKVYDAGDIDFREYEGLYCVGCERFLTERDMVGGLCRDHERVPERRTESNYFFRMSRYFDWLAEELTRHPERVQPERYRNEALAMLREESGLGDLCISRPKSRLSWGIELPFDPDYVCYVWFDALINYLSGIGYPDGGDWERLWPHAEHLVGKDILKPHAIFWPTMLRAAGLPTFRALHVHGYWNVDARKVSKSLGNMISPLAMREKVGFDAFRYFLLREMVFGLDAGFSEAALVARVNSDLANKLGNLVSRTLNMTARYAEGCVPEPGPAEALEHEVETTARETVGMVIQGLEGFEFHRSLEALFAFVDRVNRYLDQRAPWQAARDPATAASVPTTLYTACEALRVVALLLAPFLPDAAREIACRIGLPKALDAARLPDDALAWGTLPPGATTARGAPLFPRLDLPEEGAG